MLIYTHVLVVDEKRTQFGDYPCRPDIVSKR